MKTVKNFRTKMFAFQLMILLFTTQVQQSYQQDNGFKWYEGDKFFDVKGDYTATLEEYVFRELNERGICRDEMAIKADKEEDYLGMDLFMPFMGQFFRNDELDLTSKDLTILTIHHLNTMVSYTYPENRSPRPIFMGTFIKTNVGGQGSMIVDPVTKQLDLICERHPNKKYSDFITGYSIDGGTDASRKMVLVCEDKIARLNFMTDITEEGNWRRDQDEKRSEICPVKGESKPIYCDRNGGKLMSIMALPKMPGDPKPYLIGYYSEDGGRADFTTSRVYEIAVYESDVNEIKGLPGDFKIDGHLAEIDVYRATAAGIEGMYFTIDGDACYFSKSYDELFEGGKLTKIPDFEEPTKRRTTKQNCISYFTYIGCPMGFCYENNFDASFTIKENDKTFIYFTKTNMYWKLEDSKFPLDIPRVKDAMKPVRKIDKPEEGWWAIIIGLARYLWDLFRNFLAIYYSNHPCRDYWINKGSAVCMTRSVGAAFAVPIDGGHKIFLHETVRNKWFISKSFDYGTAQQMADSPFQEGNKLYDAAWYNSKEKAVYLFSGKQYKAYKHKDNLKIDDKITWTLTEEGNLMKFGIEKDYLDAVVNKDGNGYFFHDNLFWNVSEENWEKSEVVPGNLSLLHFFGVRGECFANREEDYERLISRYTEKNWTRAQERMNAIEENRKSTSEGPTKRSRLFILWFVLGGLLIVIIAYAAMYLYSKQDDKFATKRKVEYIGSRTGKKTSPPKTSSRSSKKSTLSLNKTLSTPSSKVESKM